MKKNKTILIKINESMYNEYRKICEKHSINMSQKIRNFISDEITKINKNDNILNNESIK